MSTSVPYAFQASNKNVPQPPTMHWAIVLALTIVTFTLFGFYWAFRQAHFVKKIDPTNPKAKVAVLEVGGSLALALFAGFLGAVSAATAMRGGVVTDVSSLLNIIHTFQWVFFTVASVLVRNALVARYGVKMSMGLTWLFSIFYVQYHMTQIAKLQLPLIAAGSESAPVVGQAVPTRY